LIAIVDSGPLIAAVETDDQYHSTALGLLRRRDLELYVPALVVAEVAYMLGSRLGPMIEAQFLRGMAAFEVESPTRQDWRLIADLVERYADFPLGATDASIVVLAERLGTDVVLTFDYRHFRALRMSGGRPFTLLPD
jgi:predicted nucleic acid-binding protein